jgi:hypothetical protein
MIRLPIVGVVFLVAIAFGQSVAPADVEGWSQAKWGMTENQIMDAFKSEVPTGDGLGNIIISDYEIANGRFKVSLSMDGKTKLLNRVIIVPVTGVPAFNGPAVNPRTQFDDLKALLTKKYGQPTSSGGNNNAATWNFKSTTINLDLTTYSAGTFLALNYWQSVKGVLSTF